MNSLFMATALIPRRLLAYFDARAFDEEVRVKCKNGHVENGKLGEEDEILSRMFLAHPECRFCRKVHSP
jgi:hypothetical protein